MMAWPGMWVARAMAVLAVTDATAARARRTDGEATKTAATTRTKILLMGEPGPVHVRQTFG